MSCARIIYLASPYSHPDERIRHARYRMVCEKAAELMRKGFLVFSPIAHSHPLVEFGVPGDWSYWEYYDSEMIRRCDRLVVLMLDGWDSSTGIAAEIVIARDHGLQIDYLEFDGELKA